MYILPNNTHLHHVDILKHFLAELSSIQLSSRSFHRHRFVRFLLASIRTTTLRGTTQPISSLRKCIFQ